jgi:hypothetical protein
VLRQLLFEVGDVDNAARIAVEILRDASLWRQMRAAGLREQESYDSETLKKVYLEELQKAMRRLRAPSV